MKNNIHVLSRAIIVDQNHILLCHTQDLPNNFYFLPGGHVEHMESAKTTLERELLEEIGVKCEIKRFITCLEHSFVPKHNSICHNHEYNIIFEAESDDLKLNIPIIQQEVHIKLLWLPLIEIINIDLRPESFKKMIPELLKADNNNFFTSQMI